MPNLSLSAGSSRVAEFINQIDQQEDPFVLC